jgi:Ni/Fe-hydrogenase subunit HybB-like protein
MTAIFTLLVFIGLGGFLLQVSGEHPETAWKAYLINFLLWSSIAQGALLFSAVLHITKAKWGRPLQGLAESFAAFFPISFVLFLFLFAGREHLFPWLHHAHGKESWLNLSFLFSRDAVGLLILYGLGSGYLFNSLKLRRAQLRGTSSLLRQGPAPDGGEEERCKKRMNTLSVLYILAYAFVLTLLSFDLLMSMDPHWISTLFGPYSFVKAFYMGLGGLIILAAIAHLRFRGGSELKASHFHDLGKLFFAFCLLWGDFFYCQLLVIWYGNLPEETSYIIWRTMTPPWSRLAWIVFLVSFVIPFLILLNKKVKTMPRFMIVLCSFVLAGIWLEHLLLLGPALIPQAAGIPVGVGDLSITIGFLGLMAIAVRSFFRVFPESIPAKEGGAS